MKFCVDCANHLGESEHSLLHPIDYCRAPEAEERRNPINGIWPKCEAMRISVDSSWGTGMKPTCGRDGKWFKTK